MHHLFPICKGVLKLKLLGFKSNIYIRTDTQADVCLIFTIPGGPETPPHSLAWALVGDSELCLDYEGFYCPLNMFCLNAQKAVVVTVVNHWIVTHLSVMTPTKLSHVCLLMLTHFPKWVQASGQFFFYYLLLNITFLHSNVPFFQLILLPNSSNDALFEVHRLQTTPFTIFFDTSGLIKRYYVNASNCCWLKWQKHFMMK